MPEKWPESKHKLFNYGAKVINNNDNPVPDHVINQIANSMGSTEQQNVPVDLKSKCKAMLNNMPEVGEFTNHRQEEENKELNKYLNNGYKILNKEKGNWKEDEPPSTNNKTCLFEQKKQ